MAKHVEYVRATQLDEHRATFAESLRRNVPGRGGEVMNCVEQMVDWGRHRPGSGRGAKKIEYSCLRVLTGFRACEVARRRT